VDVRWKPRATRRHYFSIWTARWWTAFTRDQAQRAKPDPDLFIAAAKRLETDIATSIVVGDSVWDLLAAKRARALGVGLLSGGYGQTELEQAGAYRDEVGIRTAPIELG
jgi:phosphoglycolate phosphatase-like HAD superfamily hydrolase